MYLRNAAKAVIVEDGRVLAVRIHAYGDDFYILPGGGQEPGEPLDECLRREVAEEIGATVDVGKLVHVRDYIARNHEFAEREPDDHTVTFYFRCTLTSPPDPARSTELDTGQAAVEWLDLDDLDDRPLWPRMLIPILTGRRPDAPVYLGDVN